MKQMFEFVKGFDEIFLFFSKQTLPPKLSILIQQAERIINNQRLINFKSHTSFTSLSRADILSYGSLFHVDMIADVRKLITVYGQLDAWYAKQKKIEEEAAKRVSEALIQAQKVAAAQVATQKAVNKVALEYQDILISTLSMEPQRAAAIKATADIEKASKEKIIQLEQQRQAMDKNETGYGAKQAAITALIAEELKQRGLLIQKKQEELGITNGLAQARANINSMAAVSNTVAATELQNTTNLINQRVKLGQTTTEQGARDIATAQATFDARKNIADLQTQMDLATSAADRARIQLQIDKQKELNEAKLQGLSISQQEPTVMAGIQQALHGLNTSYKQYNMSMQATQTITGGIGNAIDEFVTTGKLKFGDFAKSVVQDLTKMILKAMIFKALGIGSSGGGLVGNIVGSLFGKQVGGSVKEDQAVMVGEKGPELFVPSKNGQIVKNSSLRGGSNGTNMNVGAVNNNFNVNLTDFDSMWKNAAAQNVDFMMSMQRELQTYRR
jgi:lambda family phage tail tape measure protein